MMPWTKIKIAAITDTDAVYKINRLIERGQTGPARIEVLKNLTNAQRMWLVKRPWEVKCGYDPMTLNGSTDIYVRAGKFDPVEVEVRAANLLFASML